jgi:hypothetical protein
MWIYINIRYFKILHHRTGLLTSLYVLKRSCSHHGSGEGDNFTSDLLNPNFRGSSDGNDAAEWSWSCGVAVYTFLFHYDTINLFVDDLWWILIHCCALCWIVAYWVKCVGFIDMCGLFWRLHPGRRPNRQYFKKLN